MLMKNHIRTVQSPAATAGFAVAGAFHGVGRDAGLGFVLHPCDRQDITDRFGNRCARPGTPDEGQVLGKAVQIRGDDLRLLGEGEKLGTGMLLDDTEPHLEVIGGEEVSADVDTEEPGCVGHVEVGIELLLGIIGIEGDGVQVVGIGFANRGTETLQLAGITAFLITGSAGFLGTGASGGQRKRRDRARLAVSLGNVDLAGDVRHVRVPPFVICEIEKTEIFNDVCQRNHVT